MATLLAIADDLLAFRQLVEEAAEGNDGELTPEAASALESWFDELGTQRDVKLDAYCALIREWTLRASARREEAERLAKRVRVDENAVRGLKERLKFFLELEGIKSVETARYKVSVCGNGGRQALEIGVHPTDLPAGFRRVTVTPDEEAIRSALASGEDLDLYGIRLLPRGTHLRIS